MKYYPESPMVFATYCVERKLMIYVDSRVSEVSHPFCQRILDSGYILPPVGARALFFSERL